MGINAASTGTLTVPDDANEADGTVDENGDDTGSVRTAHRPGRLSTLRRPMAFGTVAVVALSALVGWLALQSHQSRQAQNESGQFLQVARQAALNLTTIDWQHAEDDVRRIMDSASGEFHDDFAQRSQPFVEVVKQAQSVSVGTVTEAALESHSISEVQALVGVSVQTTNSTGTEPVPRAWRMRISVQKLDGQMKVSRVEFVP